MGRRCVCYFAAKSLKTMDTFKWLWEKSHKMGKTLALILVVMFLFTVFFPKAYLDWLMSKLAFAELRLPPPKETPIATMKTITFEDDRLKRNGFATLVQTISLYPEQTIKQGDTVYGYARSDLFDNENGTMWFVVRRDDGVAIATGRAYTKYNTGGFGFVPFSMMVPYLIIDGGCLLEFRKDDPKITKLSDILYTSMPVTCKATQIRIN